MIQGNASMKVLRGTAAPILIVLLLTLVFCATARHVHITDVKTKESQSETVLILTTSDPVLFNNTKLDNPPSLILSFPGSKVFSSEKEELILDKGPIKRIKNKYYDPKRQGARQLQFIIVELTKNTAYQISTLDKSIMIRIENPEPSSGSTSQEKIEIALQSQKNEETLHFEPGYLIGPEDVLSIEVWNQPDISREVVVNYDGDITIPPIRKLNVMGLTVSQTEDKLTEALSKYLIDPIVFVTIKEYNSQRVTVLGETQTGMYTLKRRTTLVEFIGQIGGLTENADTYHIKLIKRDQKVFIYNLNELINDPRKSESIIVSAGDTVYIPPLEFNKVLVLGEVENPKTMAVKGKLTLMDAITEAGGFTPDAVRRSVMVIRGELGSQQGIRIDVRQILKKADISQNIELEPGDIVYVPKTFVVYIERFLRDLAYPLTWYFWYIR